MFCCIYQVKNDNARTAEAMQNSKVRDLQSKIIEQEFEHKKLEDENYNYKTRLDRQVHIYLCKILSHGKTP